MGKFPDPVQPSRRVRKERLQRRKHLVTNASRGVVLRCVIIVAELAGVAFFGSAALLIDALASSLDVLASIVLIWCIHRADQPPDEEHPMGHGRFEPVAGLLLGFMLLILGLVSVFDQVKELFVGKVGDVPIEGLAWLIPFFAVGLLEMGYHFLRKSAKKNHSPALYADAVHYRIDAIGSFLALVALSLGSIIPAYSHIFDHIGALSIAILMVGIGFYAARKNIHQLVDRTPPQEFFDRVRNAAMETEGVLATEKLRLQIYGPDAHVAIDIEVDPFLSVEAAHKMTQRVRHSIQMAWPAVRDVMVHVEPYYPGDHES